MPIFFIRVENAVDLPVSQAIDAYCHSLGGEVEANVTSLSLSHSCQKNTPNELGLHCKSIIVNFLASSESFIYQSPKHTVLTYWSKCSPISSERHTKKKNKNRTHLIFDFFLSF